MLSVSFAALRLAALAILCGQVSARRISKAKIPNGEAWSRPGSGITCERLGHNDCVPGAPRDNFGNDFKGAGFRWTRDLCKTDSDNDGLTNGEELGDPCCKWSMMHHTPLRLTRLSHPGVKDEAGARFARKCTSPMLPRKVGSCVSTEDRTAAACICFAVITEEFQPDGRETIVKMCRKLFGLKERINMFGYTCARFADDTGVLNTTAINLGAIGKCCRCKNSGHYLLLLK